MEIVVVLMALALGFALGYDWGITAEMKRQTKREWELWEKEKLRLKRLG
jgi:hypothetical protein